MKHELSSERLYSKFEAPSGSEVPMTLNVDSKQRCIALHLVKLEEVSRSSHCFPSPAVAVT